MDSNDERVIFRGSWYPNWFFAAIAYDIIPARVTKRMKRTGEDYEKALESIVSDKEVTTVIIGDNFYKNLHKACEGEHVGYSAVRYAIFSNGYTKEEAITEMKKRA
jgi:uncharacterized ferritin-like protein (DUF455 family)